MDIKEFLKFNGIGSEQLDDLVYEIASRDAAAVNNSGIDAQLDFIIEVGGWGEQEIKDYLIDS